MADLQKDRSTVLSSAARTASTASPQKSLIKRHTGIIVYLSVTAASGTGGLKVQVRGYDSFGNVYALNGGGTAKTAVGRYCYILFPGGGAAAADVADIANVPVPQQFDIYVVHADGSSYTYSVDVELIP